MKTIVRLAGLSLALLALSVSTGYKTAMTTPEQNQTAPNSVNSRADKWPDDMPVAQVRIARPTDKFAEVIRFYGEGLGLKKIGSFSGHAGYDGIMFGLPGSLYHLEFTHHAHGSPGKAPSKDNLLVLYLPDRTAIDRIAKRLKNMGYPAVAPENPYWAERGVTIEDPDGWRIVLMNAADF